MGADETADRRIGRENARGRLATDDELGAEQLATMDSLWHACREDGVSDDDAAQVERLVRTGQLGSARYWLGVARRDARERAERQRADRERG